MKQKLLILFVLMTSSMAALALDRESTAFTVDGICYSWSNQDNKTVKVCDCTLSGAVKIPSKVTVPAGKPLAGEVCTVITIATKALSDRNNITELSIPNTVIWIDNNAFHNMNGLEKVIFEDGTEKLNVGYDEGWVMDDEIFYDCDKLNYAYLGRDISYRNSSKDKPFEDVSTLKTLEVGPTVTYIGGSFCADSGLQTLNLKNATSLKDIWEKAFYNCDSFNSVDFTGCISLTTIHNDAFHDCDNCETINLSPCTSLEQIGEDAFCNMDKLKEVYMYGCSSLVEICESAFENNDKFTNLSLSNCTALKTIGTDAFSDCDELQIVDLSNLYVTDDII